MAQKLLKSALYISKNKSPIKLSFSNELSMIAILQNKHDDIFLLSVDLYNKNNDKMTNIGYCLIMLFNHYFW